MAGEKIAQAAAAGVMMVKAHPVVFGVVVTVAVGVLLYEILKPKKTKEKEKPHAHSSEHTSSHCENMYYYDPETKTVTNSAVPVSKAPDDNNNVRKRQITAKASNSDKNLSQSTKEKQNNLSDSKNVQSASNQDSTDHSKTLPDKNLDTAMSVEEKINEYFLRNISDTDSAQSGASSMNSKEGKSCKGNSGHCCNCECHSDDNTDTLSESSSVSSRSTNISSEKLNENFEREYVEDLCRVLNEEINHMNEAEASRAPSVYSVRSIESESSVGTVLSGNSDMCRGCEENVVNTCMQPCNHRYMCSDCAMRIFRLYKKCKVCRARIERIVVEE